MPCPMNSKAAECCSHLIVCSCGLSTADTPPCAQTWQDAWWAAEAAEADRKLDMLWEAEVAWQPALLVWDVMDDSSNGSAR